MKLTLNQKVDRRKKTNATAASRLGPKVETFDKLDQLAKERRSVFVKGCVGLLPAIVIMNMSTAHVFRWIKAGAVFEYNKK